MANHCSIVKNKFHSQLKALLDKTAETGKEYAIPICDDGTLGEVSEGNNDTVMVKSNSCKRVLGTFHSHPQHYNKDDDAFFSAVDQFVSRNSAMDFHCLGYFTKDKPKILCAKPMDAARTKTFLELENAGRTINEMYRYNVMPASSYQQFYDVYKELGLAFNDSCREDL